jgi:hypothetical protein
VGLLVEIKTSDNAASDGLVRETLVTWCAIIARDLESVARPIQELLNPFDRHTEVHRYLTRCRRSLATPQQRPTELREDLTLLRRERSLSGGSDRGHAVHDVPHRPPVRRPDRQFWRVCR